MLFNLTNSLTLVKSVKKFKGWDIAEQIEYSALEEEKDAVLKEHAKLTQLIKLKCGLDKKKLKLNNSLNKLNLIKSHIK